MTTATDIINLALGELGVKAPGQAVSGDELPDCFERLNTLLDSWKTTSLYAYTKTTITATVTAQTATIGTSQLFNVERPVALLDGCRYRLNNVDFSIRVVTFAEYQRIPDKAQPGDPVVVYYQATAPTGLVYFWPAPTSSVVTLACAVRLQEFADLTTDYDLPQGVKRALYLTLAEEVAASYERQVSPLTARNATTARRMVKRSNVEVPVLCTDLPDGHRYENGRFYGY